MRFDRNIKKRGLTLCMFVVFPVTLACAQPKPQIPNVMVWDTGAPLGTAMDLQSRDRWQAVPPDLLMLESNYAAAAADPSHYGRVFSFTGDTVLENQHVTVAFPSDRGRVVVYTKAGLKRKVELIPLELKGKSARIAQCSLLQNTGDEATLEVSFSARGVRGDLNVVFSLGQTGIIGIKPAEDMRGVSIVSEIEYGVAPHFIGDDLVFSPQHDPAQNSLSIPCDNLLLGLLKGQEDVLVVTWPTGKQTLTLTENRDGQKQGLFESVDFEHNGKGLYLALISAPGIWHKEALQRTYLEKDIAINWQRPFPAKWKTQLLEGRTKTTFVFKDTKQKIWRGAIGHYTHPVWFDGNTTMYRLSKKIPPKGESIVYFAERNRTPLSVSSPVDIMRASLGRETCDTILDNPGRLLRTHHRRGAAGIRRACTCGCTAAIEAVFKDGDEVTRKAYVEGAVDDMVYFVRRHMERLDEYQTFAKNTIALLERTGRSTDELKSYVDPLILTTRELQEEYNRARDHMRTLAYTDQLARQTKALTRSKKPGNLKLCLELGKQWRAMGGAQDDVIAQSHRIVRTLFQEAGYGCVGNPQAVETAKEIMEMCKQCLRNPDGYEIWPNY
jgi:hypothetical protein